MKILMAVAKYDLTGKSPYLTNEMAEALAGQGHDVTVLYLDWEAQADRTILNEPSGVQVFVNRTIPRGHSRMQQMRKWLLSPLRYLHFREALRESYDLALFYSPLFVAYPVILHPSLRKSIKLCFYWDFFPYHQVVLGMIPSGIIAYGLQQVEGFLLKQMNFICLMSKKNAEGFVNVFRWKNLGRLRLLPIWGSSTSTAVPAISAHEPPFCVFGGQLAPGRNIESLIKAAAHLMPGAELRIYGDGPLRSELEALVTGLRLKNVRFMGQVTRLEYLAAISSASVGLIITDVGAKTNSFPSKVIDYFKSSLPVVAITERYSDFGEFIERTTQSGVAVYSEEPSAIAQAINTMISHPGRQDFGQRGKNYFFSHMTAEAVASKIIKFCKDASSK